MSARERRDGKTKVVIGQGGFVGRMASLEEKRDRKKGRHVAQQACAEKNGPICHERKHKILNLGIITHIYYGLPTFIKPDFTFY